jgi:hypothetical protein
VGSAVRRAPHEVGVGTNDAEARHRVPMADLVFVIVTVAFFGLSWVYVRALDHL